MVHARPTGDAPHSIEPRAIDVDPTLLPLRDDTRPELAQRIKEAVWQRLVPSATPIMEHAGRIGRFVVLEPIGRGGMGVVYAVYDEQLDRRVALKLLGHESAPGLRARLQREARALARLSHPNVVPVFEVGEHEGQLFIVMEYVQGRTFRRWIAETKPEPARILDACIQAGRGLSAAHQAGLIHRDFKPENMIVGENGRVRVLDFGLARGHQETSRLATDSQPALGGDTFDTRLTVTGSILGTPAYMAPEQMFGEPTDHRCDQFAFCVVVWEALCGERPFAGGNASVLLETVAAGMIQPPPRDSSMLTWLRRVLERGLSRRSDARWDSMDDLLTTIERGDPAGRRRWVRRASGASLAIAVGSGSVWATRSPDDPPRPAVAVADVSIPRLPSLATTYEEFFPIGAAVDTLDMARHPAVVQQHFNRVSPVDALQFNHIQYVEGEFDWSAADEIANFARRQHIPMTGHVLLLHETTPSWMFEGLEPGEPPTIATLDARLKTHIDAVITRYADVVDVWDVVAHAFSDQPGKTWRDGAEGSKWFEYYGSEEYIFSAFKFAHDALEAHSPGSAAEKLYYVDYMVHAKVPQILALLDELRHERRIPVAGVSMSEIWKMQWPVLEDVGQAIDAIATRGYKVKMGLIDVSIYDDWSTGTLRPMPEAEFTSELERAQAERYAAMFSLYRGRAQHITSVTINGISDGHTRLDMWPVTDRDDHPLLFDDDGQPKLALEAILRF